MKNEECILLCSLDELLSFFILHLSIALILHFLLILFGSGDYFV